MFDELRAMLFGGKAAAPAATQHSIDPLQLAQAALMFHVIAADGVVTPQERQRLTDLLRTRFGLDDRMAGLLVEEARLADNEAVDLYAFTRRLKRDLDQEAREAMIRDLWQMVYADGEVHEFEDNVVWRIAELLEVESRVRLGLKRSARDIAGNS